MVHEFRVERLEGFLVAPHTPEKCMDETGEQDYDYAGFEEGVDKEGGGVGGTRNVEPRDVLDDYDDEDLNVE